MTTGMIRWSPRGELFRDRFNRLFEQAFGSDVFNAFEAGEDVSGRNWLPPVDISETDEALVLIAELPGLNKEDVDITLENNVLSIRGERTFEKETSKESYHRIERSYGAFSRSFTLPTNLVSDKVQASFSDGLLRVEIPKADEAKPRKIAIQ
jgi:HSP20 family protein